MSKIKSKTSISLKRILSVFLTLMLVQAAIPFTSFAESVADFATSESATLKLDKNTGTNLQNKIGEAHDSDVDIQQVDAFATSESDGPEVYVLDGGTSTDLQNNINKANDGDTIQINGTVTMGETVIINKSISLKGSGTLLRNHTNGPIIKVESPGKLTMEDITIDGNKLSNKNAAVEVSENSEFTMTSGVIINNYGEYNGGGICNYAGTVTINNGTISTNTTSSDGSRGGGICNFGTLTINNGTISINTTSSYNNCGGGIFNGGTLTMNGGTISENTSRRGGGIFNCGTLTVNNGTIIKNITTDDYYAYNGGGIYNESGTVTMSGGTISENTSESGGGIYNYQGTVTMSGGTISKNTAIYSAEGGGIFNWEGTVTISDGIISENTAGDGGGICNYKSGTLTLDGGIIKENTASGGGGIYNYETIIMSGGTISENTSEYGGGIYNRGTLQTFNGTITGNSASCDGGGIFNYDSGTLTFDGGTIKENTASSNGGGICNCGTLQMLDGTITGNSASCDGGGIFNCGTLTIRSGTINNNENCGVYVYEGTQFNVKGSAKIIDNGVDKHNNVIFESEDDYITITGEFTGLIKVKQNSFNKAVVKSIKNYNITPSDLSCFEADGENTYLKLIDNEIIYMKNRTDWGQIVQNKGVTYYVDENGKASAEIGSNGMIWLNTKADGSGSWCCIDNSNGLFKICSRFYFQEVGYINIYSDNIGSEYKDQIVKGKLKIFLIGVTDPDGNEYTTLDSDLTCYIKIDPDWDKNKLRAIFINGEMTEKVDVEYVGIIDGPSTGDKFAKLVIKHFSPYAIYQSISNDAEVTQLDTNANNINTNTTNDSNLKNSLTTGENFNYVYILSLWAASITALSGIVILKRKFSK